MTMIETVKDYLNDPRILNDREVMEAPRCIREIHAIRLKIQDKTAGMAPAERTEYYNRKAEAFLARSQACHISEAATR
jgi:hypothetical protein